jgi:hypothetical protein
MLSRQEPGARHAYVATEKHRRRPHRGSPDERCVPVGRCARSSYPGERVVDSQGNIYTLDAFKIKGGEKREVSVPAYVKDIVKVQVYCAWAQVIPGEAGFSSAVH